jgi:hypothetical protein
VVDCTLFLNSAFLVLEVCSCTYNRKILLKYLKKQKLYILSPVTLYPAHHHYVNSVCGLRCHQKMKLDQLFGQLKHFAILIIVRRWAGRRFHTMLWLL